MTYAVHYRYNEDTESRMAVRPEHREFLADLAEKGICLVAGAYAPSERPGGLLIFRAESAEELDALLVNDPYRRDGFVSEVEIVEWAPAVGPIADQLK